MPDARCPMPDARCPNAHPRAPRLALARSAPTSHRPIHPSLTQLVDVHDFPGDAVGKAIPYGVYDLAAKAVFRERGYRP